MPLDGESIAATIAGKTHNQSLCRRDGSVDEPPTAILVVPKLDALAKRISEIAANGKQPLWVISGGAGRSATRQVKLDKRTLTPRSARLSAAH